MPKELVYGDAITSEDDLSAVAVHWSRDQHVQIVTRVADKEQHGPQDHPIPVEYGYYVTLNRHGINNLIRNLRRARDQAYGRDE